MSKHRYASLRHCEFYEGGVIQAPYDCDEPVTVKWEGKWYCELHGDIMQGIQSTEGGIAASMGQQDEE